MTERSDETKARELVLYVCAQCEGDRHFGMKKLHKTLFAIDREAYRRLGQTVTGLEYQKLPMGPALRRLLPILRALEDNGAIMVRKEQILDYAQERPFAWREPNLGEFRAEEIAIIDRVIAESHTKTARQMEIESHEFIGWQAVEMQETIPMVLSLVSDDELNLAEWGAAIELEHDPDYVAFRRGA